MPRNRTLMILAGLVGLAVAANFAPAGAGKSGLSEDVIRKITEAAPAEAPAKPAKPRKMLVYNKCKSFRHGSIPYGAKALEVLGAKTGSFSVVVTADDAMLAPAKLAGFDAVCINNATTRWKKDGPEMKALREFVESGKGLVGVHAATDGTAGHLFGGLFSGHPWHEKVGIKIDEPKHPVNAAFAGKAFLITDEIYMFTKIYSRTKLRVLLSLDMTKTRAKGRRADNDYAVSWVRALGKGRVFYCSLGHRNEIFWNPAVLRHYLAGVQFALGDLPADATPSAEPAPKAPPFALNDQLGRKVALADLAGKIVVLEWINWQCPYSVRQYTSGTMKRLAEKYAPKGVVWLAVNSTHFATRKQDKAWIEKHKLPYPILDDSAGKVGGAYGARTTPHMFVLDRSGAIAYQGAIDDDPVGSKARKVNYVEKALDELLAGKAVSTPKTAPYGCSVKYAQ